MSKYIQSIEIQHLTPAMWAQLRRFWDESHPALPMTDTILRERIFGPSDACPEHSLCVFEGDQMIALSLLVPPRQEYTKPGDPPRGGIRWLGVHPDFRRHGRGTLLLSESCEQLRKKGAETVGFLSTPPFYIQPGVDIRAMDTIGWLTRRGFEHYRTNFNMTVDLEKFQSPSHEQIFDEMQKYPVRRARPEDRSAIEEFILREWTPGWRDEALQALTRDPIPLFVAANETEIVGFASYEVNQGNGSFGPTGVSPKHQGFGLGKRLLWATLVDMKKLGRKVSQIGWIGPVDFYYRACGAKLGPVFWGMRYDNRKGRIARPLDRTTGQQ